MRFAKSTLVALAISLAGTLVLGACGSNTAANTRSSSPPPAMAPVQATGTSCDNDTSDDIKPVVFENRGGQPAVVVDGQPYWLYLTDPTVELAGLDPNLPALCAEEDEYEPNEAGEVDSQVLAHALSPQGFPVLLARTEALPEGIAREQALQRLWDLHNTNSNRGLVYGVAALPVAGVFFLYTQSHKPKKLVKKAQQHKAGLPSTSIGSRGYTRATTRAATPVQTPSAAPAAPRTAAPTPAPVARTTTTRAPAPITTSPKPLTCKAGEVLRNNRCIKR